MAFLLKTQATDSPTDFIPGYLIYHLWLHGRCGGSLEQPLLPHFGGFLLSKLSFFLGGCAISATISQMDQGLLREKLSLLSGCPL